MVLLLLAATATTARAQLPAARLDVLFPPGGQAGSTFEVSTRGADLDDASALLFSGDGISAALKTAEDGTPVPGRFVVTIAPGTEPGFVEARLSGRYGLSNPRAFVIGDRPEVTESDGNHMHETALDVALGTVINGHTDAANSDFFAFTATKGQRVLIDVRAHRIDSQADATLTLYDAAGTELDRDRDTNRRDPLIDFTAPDDGRFVVRVHDFLNRGGGEFFYRLSIHTGPYIDFILPAAGRPGADSEFTVYGRNLPDAEPTQERTSDGKPLEKRTVRITLPADPANGTALGDRIEPRDSALDTIAYRLDSPSGVSNPVRVGFAAAPVILEQEPNDKPGQAQKITLPCELTGRFHPAGDQDWFTFDAEKGQVYWIELFSERLGLPTDPFLLLQRVTRDDDGKEKADDIKEIDDTRTNRGGNRFNTASRDPSYRFKVDHTGTYRILIRNLAGGSIADPRLVYRLAIRPPQPDFRLVALPMRPGGKSEPRQVRTATTFLRRGGTAGLEVLALAREGFNEPIHITVEDLPSGISASPAVIPAGANSTTLMLAATEDASHWAGPIRVVGRATIKEKEYTRIARGGSVLWGVADSNRQAVQARMTADVTLAVTDRELAPVRIETDGTEVLEASLAGKIEVPVRVTRRGDFNGPLSLKVFGLDGLSRGGELKLEAKATEGRLALDLRNRNNNKFRPGTFTFLIQADTKVKYRRESQANVKAEQERKRAEQHAAELAERAKAADQARAEAEKALAAAQSQLDSLETSDEAAGVSPAEAFARFSSAAETKAAAEIALSLAQAKAEAAQAASEAAQKAKDAAVKRAKGAEPKDLDVTFYSTPVTLKITEAPITLSVDAGAATLEAGAKLELPVTIQRLYDYAESVEIRLVLPKDLEGVKAEVVTIAKDKDRAVLVIEAAPETSTGRHELTVQARLKLNGQDLQVNRKVTVQIEGT